MGQTNEFFSLVGCIEDVINILNDNLDLVAIFEFLIIIALVILYYSQKAKDKDLYDQKSEECTKYHKENITLHSDIQRLRNENNRLKNDNRQLSSIQENNSKKTIAHSGSSAQKADSNLDQYNSGDNGKETNSEEESVVADNHCEYNYLELSNKGKFLKLKTTDEKCYFRTWIDGNVRKYEFWGNTAKALANLNATFDDSCVIEGKQNGATEIINVEPGILSDDLTIKTKAKIRLQ